MKEKKKNFWKASINGARCTNKWSFAKSADIRVSGSTGRFGLKAALRCMII
jgi:hypothetical protein